jgi:hypothetical protein
MSSHQSGTPQRQTTITKITTETTTTITTEIQTIPPPPGSVPPDFHTNNVSPEQPRSRSPSTTDTSISSYASHPDDVRQPLPNEAVDGFYVVLTGRKPGIFFSR